MSNTVRVRIAVAVSADGHAWGYGGTMGNKPRRMSDDGMSSGALGSCDGEGPKTVHFLEADIPLPVSQTIEARVVEGSP